MSPEIQIILSFVLWSAIVIIVGLWYLLSLLALIPYLFGQHAGIDKVFYIFGYLFGPIILPVGLGLYFGWKLLSILFGMVVLILFSIVSWFYCLYAHLPFGGGTKGLLKITGFLLEKIRAFMERLGIKQLFAGSPPRQLKPIQS